MSCKQENGLNVLSAGASIDRDRCVSWVGAILLESETQRTEGTTKSAFVQTWRDQLPEVWRDQAQLGLLEVCCDVHKRPSCEALNVTTQGKFLQLSRGAITFKNDVKAASDSKSATATAADVSGKGARKWHEKFKNARR